jgi:predicted short-subunit dehydrogenase-like oxidoreductase (DUF2520 family)
MHIALIGSGNVATQMGLALKKAGHQIDAIVSRHEGHAQQLASALDAQWHTSVMNLNEKMDVIIISVNDNAIDEIANQLKPTNAIVVHTAGSIPMSVLSRFDRHGVIYPLQTLSKQKEIDMREVPFLIEGNSPDTTTIIQDLAHTISDNVASGTSEQRQQVHLAAVFACNFTNHLYTIAEKLLRSSGLSFKLLMPLIEETTRKIHHLSPIDSQTGPAIRHDTRVMHQHMNALADDPQLQHIYELLSQSIMDHHQQNTKK